MEISKRGGSVRNRFIFISIVISIFILFFITSLTIGNNSSEQNNVSNTTTEVNLTVNSSIDNISNTTSNPETLTNTNNTIRADEIILESSSISNIVNARTETYTLDDGYYNAIFHSEDIFKFYNNQWYDLISLANISVSDNKFYISYDNNYITLDPYIVYNGNKINLTNLDSLLFNRINPAARLLKSRNYFKFAINFSNIGNISEVGFDYQGNVKITPEENRIVLDDILVVDFQDLIDLNYNVSLTENSIKITNLKDGFNDLDPSVQFNSSSKDGRVRGPVGGTGDGESAVSAGTSQTAGYFTDFIDDKEDRVFFNFNTSSLPDNAVIQLVQLFFRVSAVTDIDVNGFPCNGFGWNYHIYNGTFIGSSLDITDYSKGGHTGANVDLGTVQGYTINLLNETINKTGDSDFVLRPNFQYTAGCKALNTIVMSESSGNKPYLNITYTSLVYNLTYDANGNLIQGFNKFFEYDGYYRLTRVRQNNANGAIIAEYFYDDKGNRIKKVEVQFPTNQTIYYIGNFIQVRNSSGVFNSTFYYDKDALVGEKRYDGNTYFYHPDHLGSTQLVTNTTGDVVENTSYNPYGEVIQDGKSRYLFTGKELDRETNFEYYGARYYYPYIARFIQPDPLIQDYYNPQSLNRYSYVLNNPYKYVDPNGNFVWDVVDVSFFIWDVKTTIENPSLENIGWATLSGVSLLPLLPNVAGYARYGEKALELTKDLNKIGKIEGTAQGFKSFIQRNFRENVGILRGRELAKSSEEAHHILPQVQRERFAELGINVDAPQFGVALGTAEHRTLSGGYDRAWKEFFTKNANPSNEQIIQQASRLSDKYGYKIDYDAFVKELYRQRPGV